MYKNSNNFSIITIMKVITTTKLTVIKFILFLIAAINADSIVDLPQLGRIEGKLDNSLNGRQFHSFEGIPYAVPPVGKYRFREPQPLKQPWKGTIKATTIYKCLQYNHYTPPDGDFVIGEEDCLYLNIYTPTLDKNAKLDVIVYIHGGAFMFNYAGFQQPHYILDKNIVYVSLNYRLGPLGFLSTENELVPGNNGIKDQIVALQFIKDHIQYFGGNPNSITIIGMSAGGASVNLHMLTRKSRGLFHGAISQSGCVLNPWVLMERPLEKTRKLAAIVGCDSDNLKELIDCLRHRPGRQILQSVKHFQPFLYNPFSPFGVVIDGGWSKDPLLTDHPYRLISNGDIADVPWIVSNVGSEGLYPGADFYHDQNMDELDKKWDDLLPFILDYNYTIDPNQQRSISRKIREFYLKDQPLTKQTFMQLIQLLSDRLFMVDLEKAARRQASMMKSSVYYYYFSYRGQHSRSEDRTGTRINFGASHGDDTSYIFKTTMDTISDGDDRKMVDLLIEMVTTFARDRVPKVPIVWTSVSKNIEDPLIYLNISSADELRIETVKFLGNRQFWDSLPFQENEKLFFTRDEL